MSKNLILYFFIAIIYLVDEKINQLFEINGIGFLLILLLCIYFHIKNNIKIVLSKKFILLVSLFYIYVFISILFSPCSPNSKYLFSVILLLPYLILIKSGFILNIINYAKVRNFIIVITISLLCIQFIGGDLYRFIRPQYEYSWTALYLSPFIMYNLLINKFDKLSIFSVFIILLTSFSSTFLIILVLFFSFTIIKSKKYLGLILLTFPLFLYLYVQPFYERIETILNYSKSDFMNLSAVVWLNGFSMARNSLTLTNGLGLGFNSMGCSNNIRFYGEYMDQIFQLSGSMLNILDGSFLASKLISELGFIGVCIVFILTFKCISILFKGVFNNYRFDWGDCIRITGAILTISFLYIRGGGYYQLSFLMAISMLFAFNSKVANKCP